MVASTNSEIMPRAVAYGGSGFGTVLHALFGCGIPSSCHGRRMQARMRKVGCLAWDPGFLWCGCRARSGLWCRSPVLRSWPRLDPVPCRRLPYSASAGLLVEGFGCELQGHTIAEHAFDRIP